MSESGIRGGVALVAGNLSCIGIVLVFPFCASVAELWRGSTEFPVHVYFAPAVGFGLALGVCLVLAVTSLVLRAERAGSAVPAMLALTLIGIQLLVFLGFAALSSMASGAG
jgi:hypothetical protein